MNKCNKTVATGAIPLNENSSVPLSLASISPSSSLPLDGLWKYLCKLVGRSVGWFNTGPLTLPLSVDVINRFSSLSLSLSLRSSSESRRVEKISHAFWKWSRICDTPTRGASPFKRSNEPKRCLLQASNG